MKIKLAVSDESYEEVKKFLESKGIELDNNAAFLLTETDKYINHLTVRDKDNSSKLYISVDDIIYIESFGHTVEVHTSEGTYLSGERLYQLCGILNPQSFVRISNSVIIARNKVKEITPAFSMKFTLKMVNGDKVYVTRSYYNIFKEYFGI
ncbi:MAG: LytTR family transcriptional regulator [Ruminiclostridium sp.]|nr:LytTR family transcriptional regulator [Ruminiclostridium sp.]